MDSTAITFCMDNSLPIIVFDVTQPGNIIKALIGDPIGTLVSSGEGRRDARRRSTKRSDKMHKAVAHLQEEFGGDPHRTRHARRSSRS